MNHKAWIAAFVSIALLVILNGTTSAQITLPLPTTEPASASVPKPTDKLSFRLEALRRSAELRSASPVAQARALSLPLKGAGSLLYDNQGRILVQLRMADLSEVQLRALRTAGAQIVNTSDQYGVVTAFVSTSNLTAVANLLSVQSMHEILAPMVGGGSNPLLPQLKAHTSSVSCSSHIHISEGDTQLNASPARSTYSIDGSGVKVGVLSDSFDQDVAAVTHASEDIVSGELPGQANPCGYLSAIDVIANSNSPFVGDEGRAMLQIVHDLAPGSTLYFASAWNGLFSFADNIRALRAAGANIIADDISYFDEPFFQEGPVNVAISDVVGSGAIYFTAAGNDNQSVGGQNVASYEALSYRPVSCPLVTYLGVQDPLIGDCHNFDASGGTNTGSGVTLANGGTLHVIFQYAEPWYGVTDDLDIYLLDNGNNIVSESYDDNLATQEPFENLYYQNTSGSAQSYKIVINRYSGNGAPRLKYIFVQDTYGLVSVQYSSPTGSDIVGPTLYGHAASLYGFGVAAVPYNNSQFPEVYSSRGPAVHYFGPVLSTTPAAPINPQLVQEPDFAATDGGCNSFFGGFQNGAYRFYGTSAAAPHAAAVAALLMQRANQRGIAFTQTYAKSVLKSSAQPVINGNVNSVGAGLLDALRGADWLSSYEHLYFLPWIKR